MVEPLINHGTDINEYGDNEVSYLEEAARAGNQETLSILLTAGADINGGSRYSPLDALLERWKKIDESTATSIFEHLVNTPGIQSPNALTRTEVLGNDYLMTRLLNSGFGRIKGQVAQGLHITSGCEAVETIKHKNLRALRVLVDHGVELDSEDRGGYTALLHALDKGYTPFIRVLIVGGASIAQRTTSGLSPLDVAKQNGAALHPRKPIFVGAFAHTRGMKEVSYEEDMKLCLCCRMG